MKRLFQAFSADRSGNVAITAAIATPVLAMAVAAAVTYNDAATVRTDMQQALDAAVLAGAGLPTGAKAKERIEAAEKSYDANRTQFLKNAGEEKPPVFKVNGTEVSGQVSAVVKAPFGLLLGKESVEVAVTSAADKGFSTPICVLALNGLEQGAFDINGNAEFTARNCAAQANSKDGSAMRSVGASKARAAKFGVSGGRKGDAFSPPPIEGVEPVADPFASLKFPPIEECLPEQRIHSEDRVLDPGTYCGGIKISSGSRVTLRPGRYIMKDGPFHVQSDSVVTGDNVLIGFTGKGSTLYVWGGATLKLTSPTSGPWMNIQFMQDRFDESTRGGWSSVTGSSLIEYDGVWYFPTQNIWVLGDAIVRGKSPNLIMVGDKIWVQGNAQLDLRQENARKLPVADAPKLKDGLRLIN